MKAYQKWILAVLLLTAVIAGIFLEIAPDSIPAHYNYLGEVDRWGSKYEFLLFPVISLLFGGFMAFMARFEGKAGRDSNETLVGVVGIFVLIMFLGIYLIAMAKAVGLSEQSWKLSGLSYKATMILLMVLLIVLSNFMPKARRNSVYGLRTKWSMANDRCWQKCQRLGGWLCVATGAAGIFLISICPGSWTIGITLFLILLMAGLDIWGSRRIYEKDKAQNP